MARTIINISNAVVNNPSVRMKNPVDFTVNAGEVIVVAGENGAGKSLLTDIVLDTFPLLQGKAEYHFEKGTSVYENIKILTFRDSYGAADAGYYYQQRWNRTGQENIPTVAEVLGAEALEKDIFGIRKLGEKKLILLSSGELRKFQIAKALASCPQVLILDNPFIGLDARARDELGRMLWDVSQMMCIVLVVSMLDDIPLCATHVFTVEECRKFKKMTRGEYLKGNPLLANKAMGLPAGKKAAVTGLEYQYNAGETFYTGRQEISGISENGEIVRLNNVSIRYDDRIILHNINWVVRNGERWALTGENGSGKSTLLSLITADNPQSYACDIELFGRKRGSGESIWDIKKRIGYISPEMHRAFQKNVPAIEIVASGLLDTIGLYVKAPEEKMKYCRFWMDVFGIARLEEKLFLRLSSGEQRLVLLARAFVKDPDLLILDEPLHGLDTLNRALVRDVIETFCQRKNKTLIMVTHYPEELPQCITNCKKLIKHGF